MSDKATRVARAMRHFGVIARDRGFLDAVARSASFAVRRVRRILQDTARKRERRAARRIRGAASRLPERLDRPTAVVRIAVVSSPNRALTNATLRGLERLRDETPFSYELIAAPRDEALAALAVASHETYLAYLPAGMVPLSGWLDLSLAAIEGLHADAVAPNPGETTGFARMVTSIDLDGAIVRRCRYPSDRWAFAPEAQVVDLRPRPAPVMPARLERRRITVVDINVPMPDRDGGSMRMREILAMLASENDVTFLAAEGRNVEPYCTQLRRAGIDVVLDPDEAVSRFRGSAVVWIARPSCAVRYLAPARTANPHARIIYDTVDLHHVREQRAGDPDWQTTRDVETRAIREADVVITVSGVEREIVDALGAKRSIVVPTMHRAVSTAPPYTERSGLLFVGSFDHAPNVDAATFLAREVMPLVWERAPTIRLTIAGGNPPRSIRELRRDRINVAGYVKNLDALLRSHRLSVAPLRFGAGLKAKITQTFAYGLPVICTSVAAEGFEGAARDAMVVADGAEAFAQAVLTIYDDETAWQRLANRARKSAEKYTPSAITQAVFDAVGAAVPY